MYDLIPEDIQKISCVLQQMDCNFSALACDGEVVGFPSVDEREIYKDGIILKMQRGRRKSSRLVLDHLYVVKAQLELIVSIHRYNPHAFKHPVDLVQQNAQTKGLYELKDTVPANLICSLPIERVKENLELIKTMIQRIESNIDFAVGMSRALDHLKQFGSEIGKQAVFGVSHIGDIFYYFGTGIGAIRHMSKYLAYKTASYVVEVDPNTLTNIIKDLDEYLDHLSRPIGILDFPYTFHTVHATVPHNHMTLGVFVKMFTQEVVDMNYYVKAFANAQTEGALDELMHHESPGNHHSMTCNMRTARPLGYCSCQTAAVDGIKRLTDMYDGILGAKIEEMQKAIKPCVCQYPEAPTHKGDGANLDNLNNMLVDLSVVLAQVYITKNPEDKTTVESLLKHTPFSSANLIEYAEKLSTQPSSAALAAYDNEFSELLHSFLRGLETYKLVYPDDKSVKLIDGWNVLHELRTFHKALSTTDIKALMASRVPKSFTMSEHGKSSNVILISALESCKQQLKQSANDSRYWYQLWDIQRVRNDVKEDESSLNPKIQPQEIPISAELNKFLLTMIEKGLLTHEAYTNLIKANKITIKNSELLSIMIQLSSVLKASGIWSSSIV